MTSKDRKAAGVNFDLEEDADRIFREFLENDQPVKNETNPPVDPARRVKKIEETIDLHGLRLDEARDEIRASIERLKQTKGTLIRLRIITGKGRHSGPGGGVLVREIYDYFRSECGPHIKKIDASPAESLIEGLPLRGHFDAILKF